MEPVRVDRVKRKPFKNHCATAEPPVKAIGSSMRGARLAVLSLIAAVVGCSQKDIDRAQALAAKGQLREAGELYVEIARSDGANLAAWDGAIDVWCRKSTNVGECMNVLDLELKVLGNLERHKDALSEVLELRARARLEQGLIAPALDDLDRAEKAMPTRSSVLTARARALLRQQEWSPATEALRRAKELDPSNPEIEELLAAIAKARPSKPHDDEGFGGERK
jgi:tetratricopeptide (TPR) repeat protein